jgi:transcriptional regulator with XRE-family HTH domain
MKEQLRRHIGVRMRNIRKSLGYTQEQMVSHFDIGRANYSRIEKGEIFPNTPILYTLKREFDVSLDWLITNEGEMFLRPGGEKEKKDEQKKIDYDDYTEEIRMLLMYMEKVPMVKHAVLGFFLEYKAKNKEYIDRILLPQEAANGLSG